MRHTLLLLVPSLVLLPGCRQLEPPPPHEETGIDSSPCDSPGPALEVEWSETQAAVPLLSWVLPEDAVRAELSFEDGPWRQSWTVEAWVPEETIQIAFPMPPNLETGVNLRVEYTEGGCTDTALALQNGYSDQTDLPPFTSTWDPATATHRDWFLFYSQLNVDGVDQRGQAVLLQDNGALVSSYDITTTRTEIISPTGNGFWSYKQTAHFDPLAIQQPWTTTLWLTGWAGEQVQLYDSVPYSHHDWAFSADERFVTTLTREVIPEILERCGLSVYGDRIIRAEIGGETQELLWSSVNDGFPLAEGCDPFESGMQVSYLNGLTSYGDTLAASASGQAFSVLVGPSDGSWWLMTNTQDGDELETVIDFPHDERHDQLFHDPHSALCSEDVDWGAGSAWPADAVTCLVSNRRRGDQPCHTVDLVLLDRTGQRIHWVASWPEIGSEECVVVSEYGNTSLIGDPNPSGDGQTRLVLYSPQTAQIDVLQLHVDPDGTAVFSSEYRLREAPKDSNIHLEGYFITAMPGFGAPHHVERLTPTGR